MKFNQATSLFAAALAFSFALGSSPAFAGGYEKPLFFSGQWGGIGGAAASAVSGAESVYFNPAGLAAGDLGLQVSANFSPTLVKFSGPLAGNASVDSKNSFVPSFGVFASYKINEKWGVGIGTYLAGGSKAIFEDVDFTNAPTQFGQAANPAFAASNATIQSNLSIVEFAIATGYEVFDGMRVGLEYRVATVHAALSSYGYSPLPPVPSLSTLTIENISGMAWNGFRVGAQYYPKESNWGLGIVWRTEAAFTGTGDVSGTATIGSAAGATAPAGTKFPIAASTATVSNVFPQTFDIGGHYDILPSRLRAHLQYTFSNYSVDQSLAIVGTAATTLATRNLSNIDQNWRNEHDIRVGFDCFEVANWVLRAGYVFSSQVTPKDRARPTFTAPGPGHTITLGAGTSFLEKKLEANLALEYGFTSATIAAGEVTAPADQTSGVAGDYSARAMAAHLGLTYRL